MVRDLFEPVAARHPSWAAPSFHLGEALLNLGEPARAEDLLRRAAKESSNQNTARLHLSRAMKDQGKDEEAERTIRDGIAANPDWIPGWLGLAQLLSQVGRDKEARTAAREAERMLGPVILKHPRAPAAHRALSKALCLQGRFGEAQGAMVLAERFAL
jgi:predicted Zn-dependent protease